MYVYVCLDVLKDVQYPITYLHYLTYLDVHLRRCRKGEWDGDGGGCTAPDNLFSHC